MEAKNLLIHRMQPVGPKSEHGSVGRLVSSTHVSIGIRVYYYSIVIMTSV